MNKKIISSACRLITLVPTMLLLAACGGSGGSGHLADGGISGTGISQGSISGFGSIHASGIRYETAAASIRFDGEPGTLDQLAVGMIITVEGSFDAASNTGTARNIEFAYTLRGAIDEIDPGSGIIEAVGQNVLSNARTIFHDTDRTNLSPGDVIAVSGHIDTNGDLLAGYIERLAAGAPATLLEGRIRDLDTPSGTFRIGKQGIGFAGARLSGFPEGGPGNGQRVRVRGMETDTILAASEIVNIDAPLAVAGEDALRIEGLVSHIASTERFRIDNREVSVLAATRFENGSIADIALNKLLLVDGRVNSAGVLEARTIRVTEPPGILLEANVEAIEPTGNTLQLLGKTITIDSFTSLRDNSSMHLQVFSLADLAIGDRLVVQATSGPAGRIATDIERIDPPADATAVSIQGEVGALIEDPVFRIDNTIIDTTGLLDLADFSEGGFIPITRAGFFASLIPDMIVKATGTFTAGSLQPGRVRTVNCCQFGVLDPDGRFVGGSTDFVFTWDGTLNTDSHSTNVNATLTSATPTPFFGFVPVLKEVRVFGPGSYVFDTGLDPALPTGFGTTNLGGAPLALNVGAGQVGAHMLFDWAGNENMDVVVAWNRDAAFSGSLGSGDDLGAKGRIFNLACVDGDGDGIPGIAMVDGPFQGLSVLFNLNQTSP